MDQVDDSPDSMDGAVFRIRGTVSFSGIPYFVVHGRIDEGTIVRGMTVTVGDGDAPMFRRPIHAVEAMLLSAATGETDVALAFVYADNAERAAWEAIAWPEILRIPPFADGQR